MRDQVAKENHPLDLYLHVGDMAYSDGTDSQFQTNFFQAYESTLRQGTATGKAFGDLMQVRQFMTGPGVLALLHRYNADSRDGGQAQRMEVLGSTEGVWNCTAVGYCSEVCPKGVDPANAVNQNKVNSAKDYFLRFLSPRGSKS